MDGAKESCRAQRGHGGSIKVPEGLSAFRFTAGADEFALVSFDLSGLGSRRARADERLTPAEREVFALALDGLSDSQIASIRRTSLRTTGNQLSSIYRKLGIRGRRELCSRP